jgi:type IV pilus assembly protein PilB
VSQAVKSDEVNIITVEDPVEFELVGINQVQINEKVRLTFPMCFAPFYDKTPM